MISTSTRRSPARRPPRIGARRSSPMDRADTECSPHARSRHAELLRTSRCTTSWRWNCESLEPITLRQVSTATTDSDGGFSDEVLPSIFRHFGALRCDRGDNEDLERRYNRDPRRSLRTGKLVDAVSQAKSDSNTETDTTRMVRQADRIGKQCLPAVQQLDAAGLLEVKDVRTGRTYQSTLPNR